jgi:hypothetical protein
MKTFQEWLELQEGRFDRYPSAFGGDNIDSLGKSRASGLSYGGRSLANWKDINHDRKRIEYERSVDQLSRDENGVPTINADMVKKIQDLLDRKGLTIYKEAPNRFAVMNSNGNVEFHSDSWSDIERTLSLI